MDATIWCTCPRCYGRQYTNVPEYLADHVDGDVAWSEVKVVVPAVNRPYHSTYQGIEDEDGELQVLVNVYPEDGVAEVSYRRHKWETWSAPTECIDVAKAEEQSRANHPSNISRVQ
jgi:hypothetical protein